MPVLSLVDAAAIAGIVACLIAVAHLIVDLQKRKIPPEYFPSETRKQTHEQDISKSNDHKKKTKSWTITLGFKKEE